MRENFVESEDEFLWVLGLSGWGFIKGSRRAVRPAYIYTDTLTKARLLPSLAFAQIIFVLHDVPSFHGKITQ